MQAGFNRTGRIRSACVAAVTFWLAANPASAQTAPASPPVAATMTSADMRDLLEAARATAKATRETVDYGRVVPDILQQVLIKLDKIEDKLNKVEEAVKASGRRR